MTAPRPEIERWVPSEGMDSLSLFPDLSGPGRTEYVVYTDHLRAVTLAKIEVLEEMLQQVSVLSDFKSMHVTEWLDIKIAALRKEIG